MKLQFVRPSAHWSTADVANGLYTALSSAGHECAVYYLDNRLQLMHSAILPLVPKGYQVNVDDVCMLASEGLVYQAVINSCRWSLIINGMALHPNAIVALNRIGIKVACWFTEGPYDTEPDKELQLAQLCDIAFVNERTVVSKFQEVMDKMGRGGKAYYLPHAIDPTVHHPYIPGLDEPITEEEKSDVLLIGSGFVERQALLEGIDWTGINFKLAGLWTGIKEPSYLAKYLTNGSINCIDNKVTARLYRGAKIVINPHRWHETAESANPRTFEAAACGAFQISDRRTEVVDVFGYSIPTYDTGIPWQLESMIRRYLEDNETRTRLAYDACQIAAKETFAKRTETIVSAIYAHSLQKV